MDELDHPLESNAILTLRRQIRFQDGRPYDARCSHVAAALQAQFGWKREWGCLRLLDSRACWQHCWNRLPNGRLLDATSDQFESRWLSDIVVLDADSPHAHAYQPAPPGWTFTPREQTAGIELGAIQDGAAPPERVIPCVSWLTAADQALILMTGWSVPLDLVDYTARILRVRALLHQSVASGDLDGLLTVYEGAHAAAARGVLWIAPEYLANAVCKLTCERKSSWSILRNTSTILRRRAMNLDDFIITCFCQIDEMLPAVLGERQLRHSGRRPQLSDSEVITMEIVAAYLGLTQDQAIYDYFRQHYAHFFPALGRLHRTSFVRHAANLWALKERLWCWLRDERLMYDPSLSIIDSVPLPVCRFARAPWCARFRGIASFGKDHTDRQTFYGFRLHLRLSWPCLITEAFLAPANEADGEIAPLLLQDSQGVVLGDRNYWLPDLQAFLRSKGVHLLAPFRLAHSPRTAAYESPVLGRVRYRIDTVFGQLTDRCGLKRLWARDLWHLRNRVLRVILMHTVCVWLNQQDQAPLLQFDRLVA